MQLARVRGKANEEGVFEQPFQLRGRGVAHTLLVNVPDPVGVVYLGETETENGLVEDDSGDSGALLSYRLSSASVFGEGAPVPGHMAVYDLFLGVLTYPGSPVEATLLYDSHSGSRWFRKTFHVDDSGMVNYRVPLNGRSQVLRGAVVSAGDDSSGFGFELADDLHETVLVTDGNSPFGETRRGYRFAQLSYWEDLAADGYVVHDGQLTFIVGEADPGVRVNLELIYDHD